MAAQVEQYGRTVSQIDDSMSLLKRYHVKDGKLKQLKPGFCAASNTADGSCDWELYEEELITAASIGIALAGLTCFIWFLFTLGRHCWNCCGGQKPTPSRYFCFAGNPGEFEEYKFSGVLVIKVTVVLFSLACLIMAIAGWTNNNFMNKGTHKLFKSLKNATQTTFNDYDGSLEPLELFIETFQSNPQVNLRLTLDYVDNVDLTTTNLLSNAVKASKNAANDLNAFEIARLVFLHFSFSLTAIVVISGSVAAIFSLPLVSYIAAHLGFLTLVFLWFAFGTHLAFTVANVDICSEMQAVEQLEINNSSFCGSLFMAVVDTQLSESELQAPYNVSEITRQDLLASACRIYAQYNGQVFQGTHLAHCTQNTPSTLSAGANVEGSSCSVGANWPWQVCSAAQYQRVYPIILNELVAPNCGNFTAQQCASSCANVTCRNVSQSVVNLFNSALTVDQSIPELIDLANCDFIEEFVEEAYTTTCNSLLRAVDSLWGLCVGISVLFAILTPLLILGLKRFNSENVGVGFSRERIAVSPRST